MISCGCLHLGRVLAMAGGIFKTGEMAGLCQKYVMFHCIGQPVKTQRLPGNVYIKTELRGEEAWKCRTTKQGPAFANPQVMSACLRLGTFILFCFFPFTQWFIRNIMACNFQGPESPTGEHIKHEKPNRVAFQQDNGWKGHNPPAGMRWKWKFPMCDFGINASGMGKNC